MKRFVPEYATDLKLSLMIRLNDKRISKELYLETTKRMDRVIEFCKQGFLTNREAIKEITQIFEEIY